MKGIILQILCAFKRDAVFFGTTLLVVCCAGFSIFLGSNAVVESEEAKIVYTAGFSRVAIILGFIIFVSFYIKRMFENHEMEVILSHAISRTQVLIAFFIGFALTLFTLILPVSVILILIGCKCLNVVVWSISIYFEGLLTLGFVLCCALIVRSFVHTLTACFMMYLIGRVIGSFVAYLSLSSSITITAVLGSVLKILSVFIPRLDLFGKTSWLIYGDYTLTSFLLMMSQIAIFSCIFLCIACIDFKKKEF